MANMDATTKWLIGAYPVSEIVMFRSVFAFVPFMFIIYKSNSGINLKSSACFFQITRGLLVAFTIATFFLSARHLPLANPFFMVLFCWILKWKKVSIVKMMMVAVGFSGVLLEINSIDFSFSYYSMIAVLSTVFYALAAVTKKYLSTKTLLL